MEAEAEIGPTYMRGGGCVSVWKSTRWVRRMLVKRIRQGMRRREQKMRKRKLRKRR
jgi:hypothetical protein